jgi:hypothetical protein
VTTEPTRGSTTPTPNPELDELDELPTPPGFRQPPPPRRDPLDPTTTTVGHPTTSSTTGELPDDELDDEDEFGALRDPSSLPTVGPSQVSTADPAAIAGLIGLGVDGAGLLLHRTLTPGESMTWIPSADERDAIAEPLSRIVARRVPVSSRQANDVTDGIEAAVAIAGYAVRGLVEQAELRAGGAVDVTREGPVVEHAR